MDEEGKEEASAGGSVLAPSVERMKDVRSQEGEMLTRPFIDVCSLIVPVVDKFGPAMSIVKGDVWGNLSRLESKYTSDPLKYHFLYNMVQVEIETKKAKCSSSCTIALLWLTRAMDFLVELFRNLHDHPDWSMSHACTDSYNKTLKKWHGWIGNSSFMVALKVVPDRKKVMEIIGGPKEVNLDLERFCTNFAPLLEENHKFLARVGFDHMKAP